MHVASLGRPHAHHRNCMGETVDAVQVANITTSGTNASMTARGFWKGAQETKEHLAKPMFYPDGIAKPLFCHSPYPGNYGTRLG